MKKRLNILCILVFIVLGLSLYTTGYQFGTGMKAGMSLAKEQHKEPKQSNRTRSSMPKAKRKCPSCIRKWLCALGKT